MERMAKAGNEKRTSEIDERADLLEKYRQRLQDEFSPKKKFEKYVKAEDHFESSNYLNFKKEILPKQLTHYEKLCAWSESKLNIRPSKKTADDIEKYAKLSHIEVTPTGVVSFAVLSFVISFLILGVLGYFIVQSLNGVAIGLIASAGILFAMLKLPEYFGNSWRLKASNQMVESIFYVATYMRHTPNLELAVRFASDHLLPPLSLDLKKVLWDVETDKYPSIKESLDSYLETWRQWNLEFIESMHLIEGSLLEPEDSRRIAMIDKSLNVMLQETYEKMLSYSHELKSPITLLYMLGVVLPILGLVILPMVASFLTSESTPFVILGYLILIYNLGLPIAVFYLSKSILSKRPTGYGDEDISEFDPGVKKYKNVVVNLGKKQMFVNPLFFSLLIGGAILFVGLIPVLLGITVPPERLLAEPILEESLGIKFLDYRISTVTGGLIGPYGIIASLMSLLVVLGVGVAIGLYFHLTSSNVNKIREESKKLEKEFSSALFQLGNRLGDGVPTEVAVGKVSEIMKGTNSGKFFSNVSRNLTSGGMNLADAVFDKKRGAIREFPSRLIESSMKVLLESSKKGPKIASVALINVSIYIRDIHRVNERLKDLMADIISDMKQQTTFLAPAIAGIVVGITSMIVGILGKLAEQLEIITQSSGAAATAVPTGIITLFGEGIPTYYFQIVVGLYIVEITYVLIVLINGIENGSDKISERYELGKSLLKTTVMYIAISGIVIIMFNFLAASIIGTLNLIPA